MSDVASIEPGRPFTVAVRLQMDDGWHSYWLNPGDSGEATSVEWALPEGFAVGPLQWPYPHRIDAGPLTSYGYEDEVLLLVDVSPPADLAPSTPVTLAGHAYWLICADICLLAEGALSLTLPVREGPPAPGPAAGAIAQSRALVPGAPDGLVVQATRSGGTYALRLAPADPTAWASADVEFFPTHPARLDHAAPQPVTQEGGAFLMALQRSAYAPAPADTLRGVLVVSAGEGARTGSAYLLEVPVDAARTSGAPASPAAASVWLLLGLAFAGGLLLNLMPCVFPILSIKILGLARDAQGEARSLRTNGVFFALGVVVSFWILAGLLLVLRAGGSQIGWGYQLQSPLFVALMALLFFGIGLSLLGLFEVGLGLMRWGGRLGRPSSGGPGGAFLSGILATVVASPCTAPFMGAALGAAVTLPAFEALLVFTALGLGMALPYTLFAFSPGLVRRLPAPGAWMETLKQGLAFPMFATTIWLVWVFGQQAGNNGVALLLLGCLALAAAGWLIGRWPAVQIGARTRLLTRSLAVCSLIAGFALAVLGARAPLTPPTQAATPGAGAVWQPFSLSRLAALQAGGDPVFVDFTAAWCLTCQVNKRTTLQAESVERAFVARQVSLLRADWTNQDPEITRALEAFGRSGVPVYALYPGGGGDPILLPEILTPEVILTALQRLPAATAAAPYSALPNVAR